MDENKTNNEETKKPSLDNEEDKKPSLDNEEDILRLLAISGVQLVNGYSATIVMKKASALLGGGGTLPQKLALGVAGYLLSGSLQKVLTKQALSEWARFETLYKSTKKGLKDRLAETEDQQENK